MTSAREPAQSAPFGELLFQELKWIHGVLRRDLGTYLRLAEEAAQGAPAERLERDVVQLETRSPLWMIRTNCLYYCRFVHGHHTLEDRHLFPALRRSNPALGPVVDRLEADHRRVAEYLKEIEAAADELVAEDTGEGRERLIGSLNSLAEHLLAHLAYEEENISPTLRQWDRWPRG